MLFSFIWNFYFKKYKFILISGRWTWKPCFLRVVSADVVIMHLVVVVGGAHLLFWVEVAAWVGLWVQLTAVSWPPLWRADPTFHPDREMGAALPRGCCEDGTRLGTWPVAGFSVWCSHVLTPWEGEEPAWGRADGGGEFPRACLGMTSGRRWGPPVQQGGLTSVCISTSSRDGLWKGNKGCKHTRATRTLDQR